MDMISSTKAFCFHSTKRVMQWHPAITKCYGTVKKFVIAGLRYSEDPVVTNYLLNSKDIRYSGVI